LRLAGASDSPLLDDSLHIDPAKQQSQEASNTYVARDVYPNQRARPNDPRQGTSV
jgi:hypothetical protein